MSYAALELRHRKLSHLAHIEAIAGWDEATMMPEGGGDARAEALATLRVLMHAETTAPDLADLYAAAEQEASQGKLDSWQLANLREMKRSWVRETCLPPDLVRASSRADSRSEQAWRKLRPANDWQTFLPLLTEVVARKREVAQALAAKLGLSSYDCLLDGYEPGGRSATIAALFADLREFLPPFIRAVGERQKLVQTLVPSGPFPVERQHWLGLQLMKAVGFDFKHGRLDVSHHPFCGGVPQDVRITTRYSEADFMRSLLGVLHETGHAKYEQSLPQRWLEQPVSRARSMSVHESQSLFQEMQVSRGREFVGFAAPAIREAFPDAVAREPEAFSVENLALLWTRVRPSFIRVDADEATYPCHVIVRFEIEQRLIEGRLQVADIPEAWDGAMQELLGLSTRDNYKDGCMQDVHWPAGLFGYFPTYTLGALLAAQLFEAARQAMPDLPSRIRAGDFEPLNAWLREHVWSQGSLHETDALVVNATGRPLGTAAFRAHLQRRYLDEA